MIPGNARIPRLTAAAGTELADAYSLVTVKCLCTFLPKKRGLRTMVLCPPRGVAPSGFRPLRKIPHCCLPKESGPCLSPSVADRSLKPATDRGPGRPLPHQLANQTRAYPKAAKQPFVSRLLSSLRGIRGISLCFLRLFPSLG